jgi:hypothetical protein
MSPNLRAEMQPRIYTYKITFVDTPYYYYGVHKEKRFNEYYMGSPKTHKWCWELYEPKKQILELFDYSDGGWMEATKIEIKLIKPVFNVDKWCLNENCGNSPSLTIRSKNGKTQGNKNKELKLGICGISKEYRLLINSKGGKIAGKLLYENKKGLFGMTDENALKSQIKGGKIQGNRNKENRLGICGISKEQRSENTKKQNSTKWKCLITGHISTYNALSRYQNNRGIDKSMREIVE